MDESKSPSPSPQFSGKPEPDKSEATSATGVFGKPQNPGARTQDQDWLGSLLKEKPAATVDAASGKENPPAGPSAGPSAGPGEFTRMLQSLQSSPPPSATP